MTDGLHLHVGDCRDILRVLHSVGYRARTCVTSPPYYGLRDYGHKEQLGLEQTPEEYVAAMVEVFRCVRDVLTEDGTLWLNIGDSYARAGGTDREIPKAAKVGSTRRTLNQMPDRTQSVPSGLKSKDLIGIPWMLAFALRADGWYLRQDIIWHKPNPMPESVTDRCTKAHEYLFLFSKSERYYFDHEAIKEPAVRAGSIPDGRQRYIQHNAGGHNKDGLAANAQQPVADMRNKRSVWSIATQPYKGAHFATFPPALVEPCILAGSELGDVVLDPFGGSGTTAGVALAYGRQAILCELNQEYADLVPARVASIADKIKA